MEEISDSEERLESYDVVASLWRVPWKHNYNDNHVHSLYLDHLVKTMTPWYLCNRPPGAAGAMIISEGYIIYGNVGPADGAPSCKMLGCEIVDGHCVRTIRAEQRVIIHAAKLGAKTINTDMYTILKPCYECTKHIVTAGIRRIFYAGIAYDEDRTNELLRSSNTQCLYIDVGLKYAQEFVVKEK